MKDTSIKYTINLHYGSPTTVVARVRLRLAIAFVCIGIFLIHISIMHAVYRCNQKICLSLIERDQQPNVGEGHRRKRDNM